MCKSSSAEEQEVQQVNEYRCVLCHAIARTILYRDVPKLTTFPSSKSILDLFPHLLWGYPETSQAQTKEYTEKICAAKF